MRKIKNLIRQLHLFLGLTSGIVIFIISITGCIQVFEDEFRELADKTNLYVRPEQKPFIGLRKIITNFQQIAPKEKIMAIRISDAIPNATVILDSKKNSYYFSPFDASMIHKGKKSWFDTVQEIHQTLLLGETGKFIQRWCVVIFVFMLISGLILWFPNQKRLLRQVLTIKRKGSFKRLNYDLHSVLGFYASSILIVICLTGLFFAFKEVKMVAAFFTGTKLTDGKKIDSGPLPEVKPLAFRYDQIYSTTKAEYPGAKSTIISIRKSGELRLRMIYPYKWARNQNTFFFKESTGQLLRAKLYKDFNGADLIEATNYDLHTGRLFGLFGKIVACIVTLIAASLPITGFLIWFKKNKKPSKNKRSSSF